MISKSLYLAGLSVSSGLDAPESEPNVVASGRFSLAKERIIGRVAAFSWLIVFGAIYCALAERPALAQAKKDAEKSGVFDDDTDGDAKDKKPAAPKPAVSDRETIGFGQQSTAAQMNELEERMFRLSEALRGLEPENASRLKLALKFSREEQILEQMRETNKLLKEAQLTKAETEAKELIAKLEHLRNLLLAEDLDFQLKLARLRQMRETLAQLDRITKEQRRELGWSRFALDQRKRLDRVTARRPELETLVRDQETIIANLKSVSKDKDQKAKDARSAIAARETKLKNAVTALAADPLFADLQPPYLRRADSSLSEAAATVEKADITAAQAAAEKAIGPLRDELKRLDEQVAQMDKAIASGEYQRRSADQAKNRGTAETLQETSARLGDVGIGLRKDLIRAAASMKSAEQRLAKATGAQALEDQSAAMDVLGKTREEFSRAIEKLLVELRAELQQRLTSDMTEMHEQQTAVRETIQAQAPRVVQKSRTALVTVAGVAKSEVNLAERTEHLLALVEETEFGIALPTTLRIFSREMRRVEGWLKDADVSARTIELATRIEDDLVGLLSAVRRLPPTTPPVPGEPLSTDARQRERELNRMIAELKMVRLIQSRLNDDTVLTDKARPDPASLPPALRREVETLEATQDEIRDSLAKIAERLPFPGGDGSE